MLAKCPGMIWPGSGLECLVLFHFLKIFLVVLRESITTGLFFPGWFKQIEVVGHEYDFTVVGSCVCWFVVFWFCSF